MSTLKYLTDNSDRIASFLPGRVNRENLEKALDQVEKNGIKTNGVLVNEEADKILSILDKVKISNVTITDVAVSKYGRN